MERVLGSPLRALGRAPVFGLIADTHLNVWRKGNRFMHHLDDAFKEFERECMARSVDAVAILGDLFDTKQVVSTEGLVWTNAWIARLARKWPVLIIPGNHDLALSDKGDVNLASNYAEFENVCVASAPELVQLWNGTLFVLPYHAEPKSWLLGAAADLPHPLWCFSHLGVAGFQVHEGAQEWVSDRAAQISVNDLSGYDRVFLGHYHAYQERANAVYVSSPLQSRHGDEASRHGFVFWRAGESTHEFVENALTPRFRTFDLNKRDVATALALDGHYIRIRVKSKVQKETIVALKRRLLEHNHDVQFKFEFKEELASAVVKGWDEIAYEGPEELMERYLDAIGDKLPFPKEDLLAVVLDK